MNTSDMHRFIHRFLRRSIRRGNHAATGKSTKVSPKHFRKCAWVILAKKPTWYSQPLLHDSPAELSQPCEVLDWRKGECDLIPGKTAPNIVAVERDYPATYERFTSLGPLMDKLGNGGKGISWNTQDEIDFLGKLNYTKRDGPAHRGVR